MLTEKDAHDMERLFHVVAWCNRWLGWLGWIFAKRETISINPHRGDLNVERKTPR